MGLAVCTAAVAGSARAVDLPPLRGSSVPSFTADVAISLDGQGRPALSVSVLVPYRDLQWILLPRGYAAGAEIMVSFEPHRRGRRVYGDVRERRLVVPSFGNTVSATSAIVESRSFQVPPGRYLARVTVRDLNADEASTASEWLEVPDYSKVPVGFSDLDLGVVDSSGRFESVPARTFGLDVSRLAARVALFDRRPGPWPRAYRFRYRILDEQGSEVVGGDSAVTLTRSAEPLVVRPSNTDLFLGTYVLQVELSEGRSRWRVDRSFEVDESGPPRGKEFERMLEVLSYIADSKEIAHLRALRPEEQARGWEEFWSRRDPSPETPRNEALIEFFRRVRHAERHFEGFGPGWRSDMGRIYIKFGPPEQVETRDAGFGQVRLEIWYYSQPHRRFVFEDRDGFGRFVLVSPAFE